MIEQPVRVDHQPGVVGQHCRCAEHLRQMPGHARRADVPADMVVQVFLCDAETVQRRWHFLAGMLTEEEQRHVGRTVDDGISRRVGGGE